MTYQSSKSEQKNESWWNTRTQLEKVLFGVTTIFASAFVFVSIAFLVNSNKSWIGNIKTAKSVIFESATPYVCMTSGCVKAASHIIESMDQTVNPCDDFYRFACGGWKETKYINDDQTGITEFGALRENLNRKMRALIEGPPKKDEPFYNDMMRLMYSQCMNQTNIETYQASPLIDDIIEMGGWPVVENHEWRQESFNWLDTIIKFRNKGFNHNIFISIFVGPDFKNSTRHVPQVDQGSLGLPNRKYLLKGFNDSTVQAYYETMIDMAIALGAQNKTRVKQEMMDVILFETRLANSTIPMEERRNFTRLYNQMTIQDLTKIAPRIDWQKLVKNIFLDEISKDEVFIVKVPSVISRVDEILSQTHPRIIANYLMFRMAFSALPQLGKKWRKLTEKYDKALTGKSGERPRWDTCMRRLHGTFGVPMSGLYVRDHFDPESLEKATEMVRYIHQEFVQSLEKVDWMDHKTKMRAIEKAKGISTRIGYAKEILNHTKVAELFHGLVLKSSATFYQNVQILRKYWTDYDIKKLREPYDKSDWKKFSQAVTINAFYNSLENSIKFPAGILQGIFFDKDRPNYLNYGAIGYIIGHEITHGFDDRGRQFDKDGNNRNWWEKETDLKFQEKAQCIIDQYSNFHVLEDKNLKLNGVNTQGENIADNGGLKQAFLGYQKYVKDAGTEPGLPGLQYTPNQLFWISSANIWCAKIRLESLKLRIQTGVHSPPRFRVIGPMVNSPHFSETWKCPLGSPMNPTKKCTVW